MARLALALLLSVPQEPLSDSMSLAEIETALRAHPPSREAWAARRQIAASLDKLIRVQVRDGMTDEERAALRPLHALYLRRVDEGLDRLEKAKVVEGVRVFKFYSSSIVLKSAEGTVVVDFAQGPVNNWGEPEARDTRRTGFYWTPAQRDRLARLVDVSLMTHRHHDHSDYSLSRRMLDLGKPVVGPAQLRKHWRDLADRLTVPAYGAAQKLGPVELLTMLGMQYSRSRTDGQDLRWGEPNAETPDKDAETVFYLFRLGGIVFIQAGENHVPVGDFLRKAVAAGFAPDVRMSVGQYQGQRSADDVLKGLPRCFRLPLHDYEMTHEGGGNRMAPWFRDSDRGASMPLFWGEDFLLTREMVAALRR